MVRIKKKSSYGDEDITHLKGLEPVRENPGMFVGDITSDFGIFQITKEVVDNCIDEALADEADQIDIALDIGKDFIAVVDNGRGIPQKSIVRIMTELHSGGKFKGKSTYKISAGLHGVGVSCTNALSKELTCFSQRDGKIVEAKFSVGNVIQREKTIKKMPKIDILRHTFVYSKKRKTGTAVIFRPDWDLLTYRRIPAKRILLWLSQLPKLCPGLKINIVIIQGEKRIAKSFFSKMGLEGFARAKDFYCKNGIVECLVRFLPDMDRIIEGYVNTIRIQEGSHINAFWASLKRSIAPYAKKKGDIPRATSLRESVAGVIHVKVKNPIFTGQTKEKLGDSKVEKEVIEILDKEFRIFFKKRPEIAKRIIHQAKQIEKIDKERKSKIQALRSLEKENKRGKLPVGLAISETRNKNERELFIVEGDSAGGSAKTARNRTFQEVLPLGGKPINAERAKLATVLKSEEIKEIMLSIGGDDPDRGRVGRVIFLEDADPDGKHIRSLLITAFLKLFPAWIEQGRVFTVDSPLFHMIHKGKRIFGNTAKEVLEQTNGKGNVMRVKGWGEMRPDDLEYIAFSPKSRKLIRLRVDKKSRKRALEIMGSDTKVRKELLGLE